MSLITSNNWIKIINIYTDLLIECLVTDKTHTTNIWNSNRIYFWNKLCWFWNIFIFKDMNKQNINMYVFTRTTRNCISYKSILKSVSLILALIMTLWITQNIWSHKCTSFSCTVRFTTAFHKAFSVSYWL